MLKVKIKDFQSVSNTEFEIDGFTVIVGKNNRGKSAIVRAIDSALSNRLGNNFIRWGKLQTEVGLIKDDLDVSWVKGETSSYTINKKPYTSLNKAVPKPITDAGFKKFEIADEKLNPLIAHQFEELFLINRSGPFVTEAISTLYDLNDINDADTLCQKRLRASKSLLKTRNADIEALAGKIKKFEGLEDVKQKWEDLKKVLEKIELLKRAIAEIEQYAREYEEQKVLVDNLKGVSKLKVPSTVIAESQIKDYAWILDTHKKYETTLSIAQKLQNAPRLKLPNIEKPQQLMAEFSWLDKTIGVFYKSLQMVQKLKEVLPLSIPDIQKPGTLIQEVLILISLADKLQSTTGSCNNCKSALEKLKNLDEILSRIKALEGPVDSVSYLIGIEQTFSLKAQAFKDLKGTYDSAAQDLIDAKKELDAFKVCPLCNNPLATVEHNHG